MRVEKGKVRAPEIGRVWLNSTPLSFRQLRGRAVLVDFWDYTCVNCIRTLPYVQAWHERYRDKGLTVIGVHTPEFTFAQYESNVERGHPGIWADLPDRHRQQSRNLESFRESLLADQVLTRQEWLPALWPFRGRRLCGMRAGHSGTAARD
jgi:thiol-disulfide isomerase/thioredoxin